MRDVNDKIRALLKEKYPDLCPDLRYLSKKSIHDRKTAGARILHVEKGILLARPLDHELLTELSNPKTDLRKLPRGKFVIPQKNLLGDRIKQCEKQIKYWQSSAGAASTPYAKRYLEEWTQEKNELEGEL